MCSCLKFKNENSRKFTNYLITAFTYYYYLRYYYLFDMYKMFGLNLEINIV